MGRCSTSFVSAKHRAIRQVVTKSIPNTKKGIIQDFVRTNIDKKAAVYTDEARSYIGLPRPHEIFNHSGKEYLKEMEHTNSIKFFWALLKRGYHGAFQHIRDKRLDRYMNKFAGRQNLCELDTIDIIKAISLNMKGKRLWFRELVS